MNGFLDKLRAKWKMGLFVCVGLDSSDFNLNKSVIDQTFDLVCAYKPNSAFYEAEGLEGRRALEQTVSYIKENHPDVLIILDFKRADIGNTNASYAKDAFENLEVDAITINPYPGKEALQPFLDYKDKGVIVWVGASNKGSEEFQELLVGADQKPLYQVIAQHVEESWNTSGNCAVVVGATFPEKLKKVREIVGDMPILIPGIGAQGGDVAQTVKAGLDSNKQGIIINSSRGIIFSDNPREATLKLHEQIQEALKSV